MNEGSRYCTARTKRWHRFPPSGACWSEIRRFRDLLSSCCGGWRGRAGSSTNQEGRVGEKITQERRGRSPQLEGGKVSFVVPRKKKTKRGKEGRIILKNRVHKSKKKKSRCCSGGMR